MAFNRAVRWYVTGTVLSAGTLLWVTHSFSPTRPDLWMLATVLLVGCFVEVSRTHNKDEASLVGSLAFVIHLAVGLVIGGFWGAITAGVVKAIAEAYNRRFGLKSLFNVAERVLSVGLTFTVYHLLGGKHPPFFLDPVHARILDPSLPQVVEFRVAVLEMAIFFASAFVYFLTNSFAVNTVVALASGKPILSTWKKNTWWVLGYDLVASSLALGAAWLFLFSSSENGWMKVVPIAILIPFAVARHLYHKLNTLQDVVKELDDAYAELELNVREQLEMMVKAIEARDPYTSGHSRRVCSLSRAIAADFGLSTQEVEDIENAALLHDVGKIHAEFASILMKEGKLTDEEWEIMKTHSAKSADLVSSFSRFRGYVVSCVRHHHERWDGRGYPDRIAGTDIPLGARIITIADTIDAMTTNRPYRNALSLEIVISELNKGRNTQFDEALVELTVNSVTVRRLIADPSSIPEHLPSPRRSRRPEQSHPLLPLARSGGQGAR